MEKFTSSSNYFHLLIEIKFIKLKRFIYDDQLFLAYHNIDKETRSLHITRKINRIKYPILFKDDISKASVSLCNDLFHITEDMSLKY